MDISALKQKIDLEHLGQEVFQLMVELYPICCSITGNCFREILQQIAQHIPLTRYEIPTGTQIFDWIVLKEWNIRDTYVKNSNGDQVIDFQKSNLHLVNYSVPVHQKLSLEELKAHLYTRN